MDKPKAMMKIITAETEELLEQAKANTSPI